MTRAFHRPATLDEALDLAASHGDAAAFLAGGTVVDPNALRAAPEVLIDLSALGLDAIEATADGVAIGARCTVTDLLESDLVPEPLKEAARHMGNRNIRNMATLGGHVAANESCSDLIPALIALRADVDVTNADTTLTLPVEAYAHTPADGLITRIVVPPPARRGVATRAFLLSVADRSLVVASVSLARDGDEIRDPVVAVGGVDVEIVRLKTVERALAAAPPPDPDALAAMVAEAVAPVTDHRATAAYRAHLAGVLVDQALRAAFEGVQR